MGWWVALEAEEWAEAGSFAWVPPLHLANHPRASRCPSRAAPQLLLRHLLHLLDDAIPSFIISCTSDFENSNNFLLPPGWRAERGGEPGRKGTAGAQGGGSTRYVEMVPCCCCCCCCWCWCWLVVVVVAVVVANRRCEGDEFRVYIKFGPHQ